MTTKSTVKSVAQARKGSDKMALRALSNFDTAAAVFAAKAAPVVEKKPKLGVGKLVVRVILNHPELSNQDILQKVLGKFPEAKTSYACIAWYKSKLRAEGKIPARRT